MHFFLVQKTFQTISMKTKNFFCNITFFAFVLLLASCTKKTNEAGRYIPNDASLVVHINGNAVSKKLPWQEIKAGAIFSQIMADTNTSDYLKSALENPDNTGIDINNDLTLFLKNDSAGGYMALQGKIKDEAKFKSFYTALTNGTVTKSEDMQFLQKEQLTVAWFKEGFIMITDIPEIKTGNMMDSMRMDSTMAMAPKIYRNGINEAKLIHGLKQDNSLAENEKFSNLLEDKADVHVWFNGESFMKTYKGMAIPGMMGPLSLINLSKLTEGAITTASATFNDGKILVNAKSYSGKDLSTIWKKYEAKNISKEMLERTPTKEVAAIFALNFKPEGIREFIKLLGLDGFANMGAAYIGFSLDDFIKANKGDILLSVGDIVTDTAGKMQPSILFTAAIGDQPAFEKLIAAGKQEGNKLMGLNNNIFFSNNKEYFTIGTNKTMVDAYTTGNAKANYPFLEKMTGSPFGGYLNFEYILNASKSQMEIDSISTASFKASQQMWKDAYIKGGEFKDGGIVQQIEINLVDNKVNSLKQLNTYFNTMATLEKLRQVKNAKRTATTPAMVPRTDSMVAPK